MHQKKRSWPCAGRGLIFFALTAACVPVFSCGKINPQQADTEVRPTGAMAQPEQPDVAFYLARRARAERLIEAMNGGDYAAAAQVAREQIEAARTPEDVIIARRTLRTVRIGQGDLAGASHETAAAQACLDANPALRTAHPGLAASLLVDRAQIYESMGKLRHAAALYDEAVAAGGLSQRDARIAALNAAVLHVRLGEHAEGVARVDQYLASDAARGLARNREISLRCQQAMWLAAGGDLAGAKMRADDVLARYEGVDHPSLASVAVMRVRYTPIGHGCAERRERIAAALGMVSRLEHLDMEEFDVSHGHLDSLREQLVVLIRDTQAACPEVIHAIAANKE